MAAASFSPPRWLLVSPRPRLIRSGSCSRRPGGVQHWIVSLLILLTLLVGPNGLLTSLSILVPPGHVTPKAATSSLILTTQAQAVANQAHALGHLSLPDIQPPGSYQTSSPATPPSTPRQVRSSVPTIVAQVPLIVNESTTVTTSDQRFSLTIPAEALTSQELAQVGGPVTLRVTRIAGVVGGGSSGRVSLGTYQLELLGPNGPVTGLAFHQPVTISLHYGANEAGGFTLGSVRVVLVSNGGQPATAAPVVGAVAPAITAGAATPGSESLSTQLSRTPDTLEAHSLLAPLGVGGNAFLSFDATTPMAQWPTPQDFQANLNAGALTYAYPFSLPPGPGGFVPNLALSYSSAAVNEDHNSSVSAPWVGEGWSLDLGSINWSEQAECDAGLGVPDSTPEVGCGSYGWANTWTLSMNGSSSQLIPPDLDVLTDPPATPEVLFGSDSPPNPPLQWYTAPEDHAKIIELTCTTQDLTNTAWTHPCWRVWLPSGEMLEFGATADSMEYYVVPITSLGEGFLYYPYSWKLDAMVDPHGNQVHISYHQYTSTASITYQDSQGNPTTLTAPYVQDAELANVSYDSPTCVSTTSICASDGSTPTLWQPLVQVVFDQGIIPTRLTASDGICAIWSEYVSVLNLSYRCDAYVPAFNPSWWINTSTVTNVAVLNALEVQVRPNSASNWGLLRAYAFSYEQTSSSGVFASLPTLQDKGSLGAAGYLDLTQIQQFGTDWTGDGSNSGTSLPPLMLSYVGSMNSSISSFGCLRGQATTCGDNSVLQERYVDPLFSGEWGNVNSDTTVEWCVPWAPNSTEVGNSASYGCNNSAYGETVNQRYLAEVDTGLGGQETFTWQEGHMNVYGVPAGRSVTDPFSCTASDLSTFPCSYADAQHWSRILLVARDAKVQTTIDGATVTVDHHWSYNYAMAQVQSQNSWCSTGACPAVWDWGDVNDEDYLDFYNAQFRGFQVVQEVEQELDSGGGACTTPCTLSVTDHHYITTQGWGVWNQTEVANLGFPWGSCYNYVDAVTEDPVTPLCPTSPYWASSNMPAGAETQTDVYAGDGTTLLRRTLNTYTLNCAPPGDPTSTSSLGADWWTIDPPDNLTHLLVAELDPNNPVAVCDPHLASVQTLLVDGGSLGTAPSITTIYSYDTGQSYSGSHDYGNVTETDIVASDGGSVGGSSHAIVQTLDYTVNDTISTSETSATGTYLVDTPSQKEIHDGSASGPIQGLTRLFYDGSTSLTTPPTAGDVWQEQVADSPDGSSYHFLTTTSAYDAYGNLIATRDPNGQTGACTLTITVDGSPQAQGFSTCATYDTDSYTAHVTQETNALGQQTTNTYGSGADFGFGEWLQSATDPNTQSTTYQYDVLGRLTGVTAPGEGAGLLTTQYVYTIWCPATGPSTPCSETDTIQRLESSNTVTSRTFYDGWGQVAETRTPADESNDVVTYTTYDAREEAIFSSRPYYVGAYTGSPGSGAYSSPDSTQLGSSAVYDALGRQTQTTDPAGAVTTLKYLQATGPDSATYEGTQTSDANQHQTQILTDALGRTRYTQTFTGTGPYTLYSTTSQDYDFQGHVVAITQPDEVHTTTVSYDLAGRQTGVTDPDRGTTTYQLDSDGNIVQETDARGDTVFSGYDALDRQLWRNTTNSPTGAYVTYTYDGTVPSGVNCTGITPSSNAIGQVTTEQFTSGPDNSLSGSYCYAYDARGEQTGEVVNIADGAAPYQLHQQYDDAGVLTQQTYPTGMVAQFLYSSQERLSEITHTVDGGTNYVVHNITYNGAAGAAGEPDNYVLGGSVNACNDASPYACVHLTYNNDLRLTGETLTSPSLATTLYAVTRAYDAVGNVTSVSSTLPDVGSQSGGQDNQEFCYDDLNRLVWAGTTGTNPCTGQAVTGSTLTDAGYTASYQYDVSNRITQSTLTGALAGNPQGTYTYDSTHEHAVDAIGTDAYEAQYDAAGNMTCRTTTGPQVCTSSSQTGASLTYDVEGRLIQWVSADGSTTVKYGYDGEGNRFEMAVTTSGTTTMTNYIAGLEDQVLGSTTDDYIAFLGQPLVESHRDNSGDNIIEYLGGDGMGTPTVTGDSAGIEAAQLYGPYGQLRWSAGTLLTTYGFTGQHSDTATGLDYYNARYYDPAAGRFTSADTIIPGGGYDPAGLDAYAYADDSPTTYIDPSGNGVCDGTSGFWAFLCQAADALFNLSDIVQDYQTLTDTSKSTGDRLWAGVLWVATITMDVTFVGDLAEKGAAEGADLLSKALGDDADKTAEQTAADATDAEVGKGGDTAGSGGDGGGDSNGNSYPSGDSARQLAKDLHRELYDLVKDRYLKGGVPGTYDQFIETTSAAVADLEKDGEQFWVASLSKGGKDFANDFKTLVENKGGRYVPQQSWWGHAEEYIIWAAQQRGANVIRIGSGAADMCWNCMVLSKGGFPNIFLDVDYPRRTP